MDELTVATDNAQLRVRRYPAYGAARGSILIVHGYAEHSGYYATPIETWSEGGFEIAALDLRGHGASQAAPHGHIEAFSDYTSDIFRVLQVLAEDPTWTRQGAPFLFGHSMGGLICLCHALDHQDNLRGLATSSPFLGLRMPVPAYKRALARLLNRLRPNFAQSTGLVGAMSSSDPEMAARYDADPRLVRKATARWFVEVNRAQSDLLSRLQELRLPMIWQIAGADQIADAQLSCMSATRTSSPNIEAIVLEHEQHNLSTALNRKAIAKRYLEWFSGQSQHEAGQPWPAGE